MLFSQFLLIGGINLNWLTLLFLELTFLFPLFILLTRKKILFLYIFLSIGITIFFTIKPFSYAYYREVMFIPWSLVLLFSIFFAIQEQKNDLIHSNKLYRTTGIISFLLFLSFFIVWHPLHKSFNLIDYKYPPGLYYLSYAFFMTCIVIEISRLSFLRYERIARVYRYISKNSYQLFFIHFIVLDFVLKTNKKMSLSSNVLIQLVAVVSLSIFISIFLEKINKFSKAKAVDIKSYC